MPQKTSSPSPTRHLVAGLQPFVDSNTLAGAIALVASKDCILALETVGYGDIAAKKPMQPDSLFWIASVTKPVTATAMMMLVDDGKVSLDDPVEKYLPEFADQTVAVKQENGQVLLKKPDRPITIRHLLSQTSGLPFMSPLEIPVMDRLSLSDIVRLYALLPLQTEPGVCFQYSNENFGTAGRIIEIVSGMPYEEFLSKRLFEPLGMVDTTFWPNEEQISRLVKVYKANEEKTGLVEGSITWLTHPLNDRIRRHPTPGGGLFSTVSDTATFGRMFLAGGVFEGRRYLSEAAIREMTTKQTGDLPESYGLGWWTEGQAFGHGGAYCTNLWVNPEKQLAMVLFIQHSEFPNQMDCKVLENAFKEAAEKFAPSHKG